MYYTNKIYIEECKNRNYLCLLAVSVAKWNNIVLLAFHVDCVEKKIRKSIVKFE